MPTATFKCSANIYNSAIVLFQISYNLLIDANSIYLVPVPYQLKFCWIIAFGLWKALKLHPAYSWTWVISASCLLRKQYI